MIGYVFIVVTYNKPIILIVSHSGLQYSAFCVSCITTVKLLDTILYHNTFLIGIMEMICHYLYRIAQNFDGGKV